MIFEFSHTKNSGTYLNVYFFSREIAGHLEVIKFLVPLTKNLLVPDNEGKTALDYAIENRYANPNRYDECIRLLNSSIIRASEENK